MKNCKFSLIVPVYNVENYLSECLYSCINQTFKDIEIICVNDCSPDGSSKILEEYSKKDSRVKIITHKVNKGLGGARNTGIEAANSDFSWFIDSDDSIALNACELLNDIVCNIQADVIRFQRINYIDGKLNKVTLEGGKLSNCSWKPNKLYTKDKYITLKISNPNACMYIASTKLLKTIRFRENIVHEDGDFTPILFNEANSIYFLGMPLYFRRLVPSSITNGGEFGNISKRRIIDIILVLDTLYNYITSKKLQRNHFCVRTVVDSSFYIKQHYEKFPDIHTKERDFIIKKCGKLRIFDFYAFYIKQAFKQTLRKILGEKNCKSIKSFRNFIKSKEAT